MIGLEILPIKGVPASVDDQKGLYQRLLNLSAQLAATSDLDEIEHIAVSSLPQAFSADACAMIHLGPERGTGHISASYPTRDLEGTTLSREECRSLVPFLMAENVQFIQRDSPAGLQQLLQRFDLACAFLYPFCTQETLPAFLLLGFNSEQKTLNAENLALYQEMGQQIAWALDQAYIYRQSERRLRELRLLHQVALAISSTPDLDQVLDQVMPTLCQGLAADGCAFLTLDAVHGVLREHAASQSQAGQLEEQVVPLGQGVLGLVGQTGRPVFIPDTTADARFAPTDGEVGGALLCAPIQMGGEIVALLKLESRQPYGFRREDLFLLNNVAGQLAVAIERSRVFQQAGRQMRELTTLMRVSTAVQRFNRLEDILDLILEESVKLIGGERSCVLLLDRQSGRLRVAANRNLPAELISELKRGRGIPTSFGTFSIVLSEGELIEIPDTANDPRVERGYLPLPTQLINIPLKTDLGVIGIVELDAVSPDESSRRLLQAIADMAAVAIERVYLGDEMRQHLDEMRFLQEISLAAISTLDFDQVLRRSMESLQRRLDFAVFGFLVVDEQAGLLRLHPSYVGVPERFQDTTIPLGTGITGWVAQSGEPYLSGDVLTDPHYLASIPEIRSEICVPLKVEGRVAAVIDLESTIVNAFGMDDLRLLLAVADRLSVALQNAQVYTRERKRYRLSESMRQAAVALGSTWDMDKLLSQALLHLEYLVPYHSAFLVLFQNGQVHRTVSRGSDLPPREMWLAPDTLGAGVYTTHRAIVLPDVRQEPSWQFWPEVEKLRSWVGVPFLSRDKVLGLLLIGASEADTYTREEATVAFSFAGQLSLAIERAHFYEQERRQTERLDLLHRIGQRVLGIVDLDHLLEEAIRCLHESIAPYQSCLAMVEDDCLNILVAAGHLESSSPLPRVAFPLDSPGIISWVAQKGMPLLVPDVAQDPRFRSVSHLPNTRSEMAVPLRAKGRVLAVIDVQGDRVGQFDESDLSTLQAIGTQIGGAIERALLYEELWDSLKQLQETDQLRREFLSTINHEMRAPLTAILGFADFLLREQVGPLVPAQQEYLGDIRAAGERILALVENLLDAARLEEGQVLPCCAEVHLAEVVSRTMAIVQPAVMEKALTLSSKVSPDLAPIWADVMMLERILINLLSNAVNFSPPGGSVWIEARPSEDDEGMLEISVCDIGIGIDPKYFEEIFQRYRRLETPSVGKVGGTGLGLYIVQGLVQAHGGRIWVESQLGQGSVFRFTLPFVHTIDGAAALDA